MSTGFDNVKITTFDKRYHFWLISQSHYQQALLIQLVRDNMHYDHLSDLMCEYQGTTGP